MSRKFALIEQLARSAARLIPSRDLEWSTLFRRVDSKGEMFSISMCVRTLSIRTWQTRRSHSAGGMNRLGGRLVRPVRGRQQPVPVPTRRCLPGSQ